jgi:hypothetical protein
MTTKPRQGDVTLWGEGSRAVLAEIVVEAKKPLSAASSEEIRARDFELRPHDTIIQVLNNVPGLIVAQHQGGAKAAQYLIRGFDSDHGTDFALFADGVPVNLVSHAHGQGYSDLNFIIPESISRLVLFKGPYFTQFGDFANAGALDIVTRDEVSENSFLAEGGSFDTMRFVAQGSPKPGTGKTYLAAQVYSSNGPFLNPQNLWSYNAFAKYTLEPTPTSSLRSTAYFYAADWDASGQIPLRAVKGIYQPNVPPYGAPFTGPRLDRFGAVDPTEGGRTDKQGLNFQYEAAPVPSDQLKLQAYGYRYRLRLWSDFTFFRFTGFRFLQEPDGSVVDTGSGPIVPNATYIPGDQIEQDDDRYTFGFKGRYSHSWDPGGIPMQTRLAVENRNDDIDNLGLFRAVRRDRFFAVNKLRVWESSISGWAENQAFFGDWARLELGLRGDVFFFHAHNRLPEQDPDPNFESQAIAGNRTAGIVSPKANLVLSPPQVPNTELYLDFGTGFHSNDARVALLAPDFDPLTRSIGAEIGSRTRLLDRIDLAAALWWLDLDSELVFSGDEGVVDADIDDSTGAFVPGAASRRWGIDFEARYQLNDWLFADYDIGYADPRFRGSGLAVPLAPTLLMNGGLSARFRNGFSAGLRGRFLGERPANEERTIEASGYFLLDLVGSYRWRNVQLSLQLLNITNTDWSEAQFGDNTCLANELGTQSGCLPKPGRNPGGGIEDVHFTAGNPFAVVGGIQISF